MAIRSPESDERAALRHLNVFTNPHPVLVVLNVVWYNTSRATALKLCPGLPTVSSNLTVPGLFFGSPGHL